MARTVRVRLTPEQLEDLKAGNTLIFRLPNETIRIGTKEGESFEVDWKAFEFDWKAFDKLFEDFGKLFKTFRLRK